MPQILEDFSNAAIIAAIENNPAESFAYISRRMQWELYDGPDMLRIISGIPYMMGNYVFRAKFTSETLDTQITNALAPFKARHLPMLWYTGPSTHPAGRLGAQGVGQYASALPAQPAQVRQDQARRKTVPRTGAVPCPDGEGRHSYQLLAVADQAAVLTELDRDRLDSLSKQGPSAILRRAAPGQLLGLSEGGQ